MKKTFAALAACFAISAHASEFGTLSMLPSAANFDFHYKTAAPYSALSGAPKVLQSRFTYNGPSGAMVPQHVVLAYTQRVSGSSLYNGLGEPLWSHGAGAIVTERGLGLELWFNNGTPNAYVWDQSNGRCLMDVQGTVPPGTLCLSDTPNPDSYVTTAPGFTLQRNKPYDLRITYTPVSGWVYMHAELWDGSTGALIQQAQVGFQPSTFFPATGQGIAPSLARTPGTASEPTVSYVFTAVQ